MESTAETGQSIADYRTAHQLVHRQLADDDPDLLEALKLCSLTTSFNRVLYDTARQTLPRPPRYAFPDLLNSRAVTRYPRQHDWYQLDGQIRAGAWTQWWHEERAIGVPAVPAARRPAALAAMAGVLADRLAPAGTADGTHDNTSLVQRIRLLVVSGRVSEAVADFDAVYQEVEQRANFPLCRRLLEAIAPRDLEACLDDGIERELRDKRTEYTRRLELSEAVRPYFEQLRTYLPRRKLEGIMVRFMDRTFVDRTEPAAGPASTLEPWIGEDRQTPLVLNLHGVGGSGKSTQIAWQVARHFVQETPVLCAVVDGETLEPNRLLTHPELLLLKFANLLIGQVHAIEAADRSVHREHPLIAQDAASRLLGLKEGLILGWSLDKGADDSAAYGPFPDEPPADLSRLREDFRDALNQLAEVEGLRIMLCLDTMDDLLRVPGQPAKALLELFKYLLDNVPQVRIVLSGRADLGQDPEFKEVFGAGGCVSVEPPPFTMEEAAEYLQTIRRIPEGPAKRLVELCGADIESGPDVSPYLLSLLAELPDADLAQGRTGRALEIFVMDRHLRKMDDRLRLAVQYCSVSTQLTRDYFVNVLAPVLLGDHAGLSKETIQREGAELWAQLLVYAQRSAWISVQEAAQDSDRLIVHVNARRALRTLLRQRDDDAWLRLHQEAAEYCRLRAEEYGRHGTPVMAAGRAPGRTEPADPAKAAWWEGERIYHQLHQAVVEGPTAQSQTLATTADRWQEEVDAAWVRGDFRAVIILAERLFSTDLQDEDVPARTDRAVIPLRLWYSAALERAYGELHAAMYGGSGNWNDIKWYRDLAEQRDDIRRGAAGGAQDPADFARTRVISAALTVYRSGYRGIGPIEEAEEQLKEARKRLRALRPPTAGQRALRDQWLADAELLLAGCQLRIGLTSDDCAAIHADAQRSFEQVAAQAGSAARAALVAGYAMRDWQRADRPDLAGWWAERLHAYVRDASAAGGPWVNRLLIDRADAQLRSGRPVSVTLPAPDSGSGREALPAALLRARDALLTGGGTAAVLEAVRRDVLDPASAQGRDDVDFDTAVTLSRGYAALLDLAGAAACADRALDRARDEEDQLAVLALRATTALAVVGDPELADQWIARAAPLRDGPRGRAGTDLSRAECVAWHLRGEPGRAADRLAYWAGQLTSRQSREATDRGAPPPPAAAEWLALGVHGLVCGRPADVERYQSVIETALASIPDLQRRLMLLAEELGLYGPVLSAAPPLLPAAVGRALWQQVVSAGDFKDDADFGDAHLGGTDFDDADFGGTDFGGGDRAEAHRVGTGAGSARWAAGRRSPARIVAAEAPEGPAVVTAPAAGATSAAGLAALWSAQVQAALLGPRSGAADALRAAVRELGAAHTLVHATWLRLHRLLPVALTPAPLPSDAAPTQAPVTTLLRAADALARLRTTRRGKAARELQRTAEQALDATADTPTFWHREGAELGLLSGPAADRLVRWRDEMSMVRQRRRNLQFALRRLGRYGPEGAQPDGAVDEVWRAWAAVGGEAGPDTAVRLREQLGALPAAVRPLSRVVIEVRGDRGGGQPPYTASQMGADPGTGTEPETEDFLLAPRPPGDGVDGEAGPVDVMVLRGVLRPLEREAAFRLLGNVRAVGAEHVDRAVRSLGETRRQPPPLVVLDVPPSEQSEVEQDRLLDRFAFRLHMLGCASAVLVVGPLRELDTEGRRRWDTTLAEALSFGSTASQIAAKVGEFSVGGDGERPVSPRVRLLSYVPEEEDFGLGVL